MSISGHICCYDFKDKVERALFIALHAHSDQKDKSGEQYILHPMRVATEMYTDEGRVVALLHDVVEDTNVTIEDILYAFDEEIANAISAITHIPNEPNVDYIKRVKDNPLATSVKLQDLKDNMSPRRMAMIDSKDRERLFAKYTKAYGELMR